MYQAPSTIPQQPVQKEDDLQKMQGQWPAPPTGGMSQGTPQIPQQMGQGYPNFQMPYNPPQIQDPKSNYGTNPTNPPNTNFPQNLPFNPMSMGQMPNFQGPNGQINNTNYYQALSFLSSQMASLANQNPGLYTHTGGYSVGQQYSSTHDDAGDEKDYRGGGGYQHQGGYQNQNKQWGEKKFDNKGGFQKNDYRDNRNDFKRRDDDRDDRGGRDRGGYRDNRDKGDRGYSRRSRSRSNERRNDYRRDDRNRDRGDRDRGDKRNDYRDRSDRDRNDRGDRDRGKERDGGRFDRRGGDEDNAKDWKCLDCGNINWARRDVCNRCKVPRPENAPLVDSKKAFNKGGQEGGNRDRDHRGGDQRGNYRQGGDQRNSDNINNRK